MQEKKERKNYTQQKITRLNSQNLLSKNELQRCKLGMHIKRNVIVNNCFAFNIFNQKIGIN